MIAHLDLDSSNGKALVGLGDTPGLVRHHPERGKTVQKTRNSSAKQRRRDRRAALRESENEKVESVEVSSASTNDVKEASIGANENVDQHKVSDVTKMMVQKL